MAKNKNKIPLLTADLIAIIGKDFPADKQLFELAEKIELIRQDVNESMQAIQHLQYLRIMKMIMSN